MNFEALKLINDRISHLEKIKLNYIAYQLDRVSELDVHGIWDSAIDLAKTDAELKGLNFARDLLIKANTQST